MKVLLDTNIVIHRENVKETKPSIGLLFYWLDKLHYEKIFANDIIDHQLLCEVFNNRVDLLISEDKKLREKQKISVLGRRSIQ